MKFFIILCIALSPLTSLLGQRSLTSVEAKDLTIASTFSNSDEILEYTLPDGSVIKKGSELVLGKPVNNSRDYARIVFGYMTLGKALLTPPIQLGGSFTGSKVIIDKIFVSHKKMTKQSELNVSIYAKDPNMSSAMGASNRTIVDIESAISTGEVINPNAAMTRDQAIVKLKESKDLLDLGLMTQEEYEKLKSELTPIIVGNK
jgi:hypothetical protein